MSNNLIPNKPIETLKRAKGALLSGHPAAYGGIVLSTIAPLTRLSDSLLANFVLNRQEDETTIPPCLVIISPPRTGSTIVYQSLVRTIPSVYFTNLHYIFPQLASIYLLEKRLFGKILHTANNYYGYTQALNDVNEANPFFSRIFDTALPIPQVRSEFAELSNFLRAGSDKPLILKNVRAFSHIAMLAEAVPELVFLRISRSYVETVESIVRAYRDLGTFNPIPAGLENSKIDDPIEFAIKQIAQIETQIDMQLKTLESERYVEWTYEDFCENSWEMTEQLAEQYLNVKSEDLVRHSIHNSLNASKRRKVNPQDKQRIHELLRQYALLDSI